MARTLTDDKSRGMTDFTPRPTSYKGIKMRSRLEAGFAQWLDLRHIAWEYEPECFADEHGQYLPDFVLHDVPTFGPGTGDVYVDVKPRTVTTFDNFADLASRMSVIWLTHPDVVLAVVTPVVDPADIGLWTLLLNTDGRLDFVEASFVVASNRRVGIATLRLPWQLGPWYGEWWKG